MVLSLSTGIRNRPLCFVIMGADRYMYLVGFRYYVLYFFPGHHQLVVCHFTIYGL